MQVEMEDSRLRFTTRATVVVCDDDVIAGITFAKSGAAATILSS
jgi:hypothetical protein